MHADQALSLSTLPKVTTRSKKRVGRGYGSGKGGHTAGRGTKGQKSRGKVKWWFEGGQLPLVRRLPFWRGKGRLHSLKPKPVIIKTGQLKKLRAGSIVDLKRLIKENLVSEKEVETHGVKILVGGSKLTKKLTIKGVPISQSAADLITKTGGKIKVVKSEA